MTDKKLNLRTTEDPVEEAADEFTKNAEGEWVIPIDLPVEVIATLALAAHEQRMSLNEFLITRISEYCRELIDDCNTKYNPNFGDDKLCECGHPYYRHFDTYEDMDPVGCKYCECFTFDELITELRV